LPGVGEVFSGQYDFPARVHGPCLVLDIGANCGAFALWARLRWPHSTVICYEPHPEIFEYLRHNTAFRDSNITVVQAAVGDPALTQLHPGLDTRLCSSFHDIGRQAGFGASDHPVNPVHPVVVLPPEKLPRANIIKIDTEGSEAYILEHLTFTPDLLVVEYHTEDLRNRVEAALRGRMELLDCHVNGISAGAAGTWGHLKYARRPA
jgi:FkbM family methyltransferase